MGDERYSRYAVEDETWINFDFENTVRSSRVWQSKDSPRPQLASNRLSPRKCLLLIVLTADKKFNVQVLPYGETINWEVYRDFVHDTGEN